MEEAGDSMRGIQRAIAGFEDGGRGPWAKESRWLLEGRDSLHRISSKKEISVLQMQGNISNNLNTQKLKSPLSLQKGTQPADILILAHETIADFWPTKL